MKYKIEKKMLLLQKTHRDITIELYISQHQNPTRNGPPPTVSPLHPHGTNVQFSRIR